MSLDPGRCRSCGKPILWCTMATGKTNPLDAVPVSLPPTAPEIVLIYIEETDGLGRTFRGRKGYQSHFVTCPNRDAHRKAAPAKPPKPAKVDPQLSLGGPS